MPHSIFENIRASGKQAVLLESGKGTGKWSFVGIVNPLIKVPQGEAALDFIEIFLQKHKRKRKRGEPPFTSGFVGFLSYDLGAKWNGQARPKRASRQQITGQPETGRQQCPEAHFVYVDEVIAVKNGILRLGSYGCRAGTCEPNCNSILGDGWAIGRAPSRANGQNDGITVCGYARRFRRGNLAVKPQSNLTYQQYFQKIHAIKKYLYAGHTYQVNFSQRFKTSYCGDAFEIYKRVTEINPSPFQFFLETPDFAVVSNSPERLFKIWHAPSGKRFIETRPIKGTAPRGKNAAEDRVNIKKLLASEKEKAELEMIVDLERNDLGKICKPETICVTENRTVEKYSHVIHTVSNVRGELCKNIGFSEVFRALFPGGSVTGCPKKRTMEIIYKLEREPRGVYCGSAGYIDLSGRCDFNIMIRTLWLDKKQNKLTFRSGGGIVVDSKPSREYEETVFKAQALMEAIG